MNAKIGALFQALQLANEETDANIGKSVSGGGIENYGQLLAVTTMLSEIIKNCDFEIELPPGAESILVPFVTRHLVSGRMITL